MITALYYLVDAGAAVATGCLADLFIRRGFNTTVVRKSAMAIGWTTAAIGLAACGLGAPRSYLAWLMVSAAGNGIGMSGTFAFSQTLAGPQAAGRWVGLQNCIGNLAGVIGPALTGFLVDRTGHFQAAIALTAIMSLLAALNYVFFVGQLRQVAWLRPLETALAPGVPEIV